MAICANISNASVKSRPAAPRTCRIAAARRFRHSPCALRNRRCPRRAFSLLETTIAVGILGVGLIMVAAVFPVALTQHRNSAEMARVIEMVSEAEAMIAAKVNPADLWVHPDFVPGPFPGGTLAHLDSPWYLLPTVNLRMENNCWDAMVQTAPTGDNFYANWLNGAPVGFGNVPMLFGLDILSDRLAPYSLLPINNGPGCPDSFGVMHASASPFTQDEFMEVPNRLVWYGFYRRRSTGAFEFAAAVCKQRRNQNFVEQDVVRAAPTVDLAVANDERLLPVPWRVTVARPGVFTPPPSQCFVNRISNSPDASGSPFSGSIGLAYLAPVGSKVMISGAAQTTFPTLPPVPSGRVLTVSDIFDDYTVEVVGDLTGLPCFDFGVGLGVTFDIWVFPPAVEGGFLGREAPVLEWKVPL